MRTSVIALGKGFGNLAKVRGITKYHLSPFEQRAMGGAISTGLPNILWRFRANVMYWAPRKSQSFFGVKGNVLISEKDWEKSPSLERSPSLRFTITFFFMEIRMKILPEIK